MSKRKLTIRARMGREEYAELYYLARRAVPKRSRLASAGSLSLLTVCGFFFLLSTGGREGGVPAGAAILCALTAAMLAAAFLLPAIQKRGIRKQVDRARREGKLCDAEYTYVFEDDGFTVTSSETTVPYRWESVAQVRKGKRMLLLIVMPGKKLMPVPAGASGNGPRYERLAALLEEKIPKEKMAEFL